MHTDVNGTTIYFDVEGSELEVDGIQHAHRCSL